MNKMESAQDLISLSNLGSDFEHYSSKVLASFKKERRLEVSLEHTSDSVGFLHASCITISGKTYLLAGPSQIGKTTYSQYLVDHFGGEIVAKDWVVTEINYANDKTYVYDLNFPGVSTISDKRQLDGIFFLTERDGFERDAYSPNENEYTRALASIFDTSTPDQIERLASFWLVNRDNLPATYCVPTRQSSELSVGEVLSNLIKRQNIDYSKIGIIGLGALGQTVAFQLGFLDSVRQVHLYTKANEKSIGLSEDFNQSSVVSGKQTDYIASQNPEELLSKVDAVFFCFRNDKIQSKFSPNERWGRTESQKEIMRSYSQVLFDLDYLGAVFVLSNPVELLSRYLFNLSNLKTYQVFGLGLELDLARARYFASINFSSISPEEISVFGNHAGVFRIQSPLPEERNKLLKDQVVNASKMIRQYVARTKYGPASAAIQSLNALIHSLDSTLATIQQGGIVGHKIKFQNGLPMFFEEDESHYKDILDKNLDSFTHHL